MQIRDVIRGLYVSLFPGRQERQPSVYPRQYSRDNGPVLTALGGGTGLSTLLRGLKNYTTNLTAIVNVTDDGGSSGRLRENLGMLPPGDIRNCLIALANTEPLLEKVFQHRFTAGEGLEGHNFGNLFLAALTEEFGFEEAIMACSRVLAVSGEVLPVTLDKVSLVAQLTDGRLVRGESSIPKAGGSVKSLHLEPATSTIYPAAKKAILEAQTVIIGPGSLFTSVLANLLVPGVVEALRETQAHKVYICNVMTQPGETDGYTAAEHVKKIYEHTGEALFDTVIVNANLKIPALLLDKYALEGAAPVQPDISRIRKMGLRVVAGDMLSQIELVRHDPDKLARVILTEAIRDQKVESYLPYIREGAESARTR